MTINPEWVMTGGEGPESYKQNSSFQRALLEVGKEKIKGAISATLSLDLISDRFTVADFGCASGPNTFVAVQNIIDAVEDTYRTGTGKNPAENIEFQVLFNDFTNNDFNTLFQALPLSRKYYSAGVPGSFFGRVLPKQSIHIGLINYAFHFISSTPRGITDRNSPLWNRDMHCTGFNQAVKKAYLDQYSIDTKNILDARAQELVPGGLMLISGSCQRDGVKISETAVGIGIDIIQASISDLAQQCAIEKEKVDSFNFPLYFAEESELRQIIEENGNFTLEVLEDIIYPKVEFQLDLKVFTMSIKAGFGPLLSSHFGVEAMEKVFDLVPAKALEQVPRFLNAKPGMQYLIVLRKN